MRDSILIILACSIQGAFAASDGAAKEAMDATPVVQPNVCDSGSMQSPIDFHSCVADIEQADHMEHFNMPEERPKLKLNYGADRATVEMVCVNKKEGDDRSGCYLQMTPGSDLGVVLTNSFTAPGMGTYALEHCVLRVPSEHKVNGNTYAAEVQCLHSMDGTDGRRKAILSTLLENGFTKGDDENPSVEVSSGMISQFEKKIPNASKPILIKPFDMTPTGRAGLTRYYTYKGSQTLDNCAEEVDWFVMYDPSGISQVQLKLLKDSLSQGWLEPRETQPLYGRHPDACHHEVIPEDAASPQALGFLSLALALLSLAARA